jgi:hypothetical protein
VPAANWKVLADEIAEIGGTRDRFNTAASTAGSGYTLLGWRDAEEGQAREATGAGARLRGALVPDERSHFRPVNVNADGPPAERLQQLIARPSDPAGAWPLDDDPGARRALAWLGVKFGLGSEPRAAYWQQDGLDPTLADKIERQERPARVAGTDTDFTDADYERARKQLLDEIGWVGTVRAYLAKLSAPYEKTIIAAFPNANTLADRLEEELNIAKEQAEMQANWFEFVKGILSVAGGFEGFAAEEAAELVNLAVEVSIAAMEMGSFGYESRFNGSEERVEEAPRVKADELAKHLTDEAEESTRALERMGNVIVSDPVKLEEVGTHVCTLNNPGTSGCAPGFEEYATDSGMVDAAEQLGRIALERSLYSDLVPRSFPVWDTGSPVSRTRGGTSTARALTRSTARSTTRRSSRGRRRWTSSTRPASARATGCPSWCTANGTPTAGRRRRC